MTTIKLRRDIASNWTSVNPTLAEGEVGLITDTKKYVVGDGSTAFTSLPQYDMGSKFSTIPTGLELNISGNYLVASAGYVLGKNNTNLNSTSTITTADISTVSNATTNNVIVGSIAGYEAIPVNSSTGTFLYTQNTSTDNPSAMTADGRGQYFFQETDPGNISAGSAGRYWCLGFMFNETQPAGEYKLVFTKQDSSTLGVGNGTIGNVSTVWSKYLSGGSGHKEETFTATSPWNTIYISQGNYSNFHPSYNCIPYIYKSATRFDTYLVSSNGSLDIKMTTNISNLSSYTDYAQIGTVKYDNTNANPVAYPDEDLATAYVSGNIANSTLSNVLSIDNNSAVKTALDSKQDILGYTPVNKAGDTMTGNLTVPQLNAGASQCINIGQDNRINLIIPNVSKGTAPSSQQFQGIQINDGDSNHTTWQSKRLSGIEASVTNTGENKITITAYKNEANSTSRASFTIGYTSSPYCTFPNTNCVDGQWVSKGLSAWSGETLPTTNNLEVDLRDAENPYLPTDDDYEIIVDAIAYTSSTVDSTSFITVYGGRFSERIIAAKTLNANQSNRQAGMAIVPISKTFHKLRVNADTGNSGTFSLQIRGYRRTGTNT